MSAIRQVNVRPLTDAATRRSLCSTLIAVVLCVNLLAQAPASGSDHSKSSGASASSTDAGATIPSDYTIGPEDVLNVAIWREPEMSAEVVVRPDGRISLPLLNEIVAVGLTPDQLRATITEQAKRFVSNPSVTIVVRQIHSRKVFITGNVDRPGPYPLAGPTTVIQLIAMAGGLREYADSKHIVVMRNHNGKSTSLPFNYNDIMKRRNLQQNIELKPGDTVIVP